MKEQPSMIDVSSINDSKIKDLIYKGHFHQALQEILTILEKNELSLKEEIRLKILECKVYVEIGDIQKAEKLIEDTKLNAQEIKYTRAILDLNVILGLILIKQDKIDQCDELLKDSKRILEITTKENNTSSLERESALLFVNGCLNRKRGELDQAVENLQKSAFIAQDIGLNFEVANSLNTLGIVYGQKGDLVEAYRNLIRGLEIYETYGNRNHIVKVLNNLGMLHWNIGKFDASLEYYKKGLVIANELEDKSFAAIITLNIGLIYRDLGDLNTALEFYNNALSLFKELERTTAIGNCLNNIGQIYLMKGEVNIALENFQNSLLIKKNLQDQEGTGYCLENLGNVAEMKGDLSTAIEYHEKSLEIFESVNSYVNMSLSLYNLIRVNAFINPIDLSNPHLEKLKMLQSKNPNEIITIRYKISLASILKKSDRIYQRAEAQQILQELSGKNLKIELMVPVLLGLADLLLKELKDSGNKDVLEEVKGVINQLFRIAESQKSYFWLAWVYWLKSKLALMELDIQNAQQLLDQAYSLAKSKGLDRLEIMISNDQIVFINQLSKWQRYVDKKPPMQEIIELTQLEDLLERMIQKKLFSSEKEVLDYAAMAKTFVTRQERE